MARTTRIVSALFATSMALAPVVSNATLVLSAAAQVTQFQVYTDFGNGDVLFNINVTVAGCDAFWLSPADPGFKQAYAALVMVKASGSPVVVYAYNDALWSGSTDKYCRVRSLTPN